MKSTIENCELLLETENQLYKLRQEMSDSNEANSPINNMIDWIQKEKLRIRKKI